MTRALVIAPQWIGDAVMTEPLLRRLHARGEQLAVGALPWVAPVYRAMPQVAQVIELPFRHGGLQFRERRALGKQLHGRFDSAYVLPNSLKSALLPLLAGIPRRIGYLGESRVGLLTHRLKNPKGKPPMVAFYSALAGEPGIEQDTPRLQLDPGFIAQVLRQHGLVDGGYVVMAPGAEYGPAKRWPHFGALAQELAQPVLLLGSGKEAQLCEAIRAQAGGDCRNLAGQTSLDEAFALIAGAGNVVSNDSGLMHVAAAFGAPLNPRAQVVWLKQDPDYLPPLDCSPCFQRECPLGHLRCLHDVTPQRVRTLLHP
jgi:heptosyltransferase-2